MFYLLMIPGWFKLSLKDITYRYYIRLLSTILYHTTTEYCEIDMNSNYQKFLYSWLQCRDRVSGSDTTGNPLLTVIVVLRIRKQLVVVKAISIENTTQVKIIPHTTGTHTRRGGGRQMAQSFTKINFFAPFTRRVNLLMQALALLSSQFIIPQNFQDLVQQFMRLIKRTFAAFFSL